MTILANREHFLTVLMLLCFYAFNILNICTYICSHNVVLLTSEGPKEDKL